MVGVLKTARDDAQAGRKLSSPRHCHCGLLCIRVFSLRWVLRRHDCGHHGASAQADGQELGGASGNEFFGFGAGQSTYCGKMESDKIDEFYKRELPARGWQPGRPCAAAAPCW